MTLTPFDELAMEGGEIGTKAIGGDSGETVRMEPLCKIMDESIAIG